MNIEKNAREREDCFPLGSEIEEYGEYPCQVYVCKSAQDWLNRITNPMLKKHLHSLSTENLEILYDSFVIGYTHEEIAQQRGLSRTTVGKRINRIVNNMRINCKFDEKMS